MIVWAYSDITDFKLPPALAGGKGMNVKLALAKITIPFG
jgi:hypothetical protein